MDGIRKQKNVEKKNKKREGSGTVVEVETRDGVLSKEGKIGKKREVDGISKDRKVDKKDMWKF